MATTGQYFQLIHLPPELLEEIIHHICHPADLLSFGSSCRLLFSMTVPYPLNYRHITWPYHEDVKLGIACVEHLAEEPKRGKAVRLVTVSGSPTKPRFLPEGTFQYNIDPDLTEDEEAYLMRRRSAYIITQSTLARAMTLMPFLEGFTWTCEEPEDTSPLWASMGTLTQLKSISLDLGELRAFFSVDKVSVDDVVRNISLAACSWHQLEEMSITITRGNFPPFDAAPLLKLHFPKLINLHLSCPRGVAEEVSGFFKDHPRIEELHILGQGFDMSEVDPEALPRLRSLNVINWGPGQSNFPIGHPFLESIPSLRKLRPIQSLVAHGLTTAVRITEFRRILPGFGPTLRNLVVPHWEVMDNDDVDWIVTVLPRLVHLTLPDDHVGILTRNIVFPSCASTDLTFSVSQRPHLEAWARCFARLPQLKTLVLLPKWIEEWRNVEREYEIINELQRNEVIHPAEVFQAVDADLELTKLEIMKRSGSIIIKCERVRGYPFDDQ